MIISILLLSFQALSQSDCKFTVGGKQYDLSPLNGQTATGDDSKISTYHYTAAVCADMTTKCEDIMTGQKLQGVVYQMGGEPGQQAVCWDMLAKWDGVTAGPLDPSAKSDKDGITLSFQNGDPCRGSPRKTKMNMICDSAAIGTLSGFQDDTDSCLFIINFPTSHACSGSGPSPGPTPKPHPGPGNKSGSSSGVSGGWIFIILLICLAFFYVVGFFVYGGYQTKEWKSMENCPHTDFWGKFVGWVKVGCTISGNISLGLTKKTMRWCKSKCGKNSSDDEEEEDPDY